ncbi:MAG: beta-carotene 15,15'-monooxygenase [Bergeyella sp.]
MSDFNEFDDQGLVPARETGSIISHAFEMFKGTFLYVLLLLAITVVASTVLQMFSGIDSMGMMEEIRNAGNEYGSVDIWAMPGMKLYAGVSGLLGLLMTPLYVGLIYIFNKYNNKQKISASDLFIGYKQDFLNIVLYGIISSLILVIPIMMCVIPVFFVAPFLMLGYPVLLFENASVGAALSKSFSIAKENYGVFLGATILGILISMSGLVLCIVGVYLTAYFGLAVAYSLYVAYLGKPRPLADNAQ